MYLRLLILSVGLLVWNNAQTAVPNVVVSIKPVHALVAGVMAGVGQPMLLLPDGSSPHTYTLKPSTARVLQGAQLIVWIGPSMEGFLQKPLRALGSQARVLQLDALAGMRLWRLRSAYIAGPWEDPGRDAFQPSAVDGHLWLDVDNARRIVAAVTDRLSEMDPVHRGRYAANADAMAAALIRLDRELAHVLAPLHDRPYVVFHDGYQYLERRYGLQPIAALTMNPEHSPGARHLLQIRDKIVSSGARCVFSEPQFEPKLIRTLISGLAVETAVLDPLGVGLTSGQEAYFILMRRLAASLQGCLIAAE